jgi:hypothetical protein
MEDYRPRLRTGGSSKIISSIEKHPYNFFGIRLDVDNYLRELITETKEHNIIGFIDPEAVKSVIGMGK